MTPFSFFRSASTRGSGRGDLRFGLTSYFFHPWLFQIVVVEEPIEIAQAEVLPVQKPFLLFASFELEDDDEEEEEKLEEEGVVLIRDFEAEKKVLIEFVVLPVDAVEECVEICDGEFAASFSFLSLSHTRN